MIRAYFQKPRKWFPPKRLLKMTERGREMEKWPTLEFPAFIDLTIFESPLIGKNLPKVRRGRLRDCENYKLQESLELQNGNLSSCLYM